MEKIAILGCGRSGNAAIELAVAHGMAPIVFDEKVEFIPSFPDLKIYKSPEPAMFSDCHYIVASPGISQSSPLMQKAVESEKPIISELEFGYCHCQFPVIGITGTNGKTTTTELTVRLLHAIGYNAEATGNIGTPISETALSRELDVAVAEVSSFQLEAIKTFSPHTAAILNLSSDHLNRYSGFEEYVLTKFRIFENMSHSNCIINYNLLTEWKKHRSNLTPLTFSATNEEADFHLEKNFIVFQGKPLINLSDLKISGNHNYENLMAALGLVKMFAGKKALFSKELLHSACEYHAGSHRFELIAEKNRIRYINDSKATNPHSVIAALDAIEDSKVCLILGGLDKDMDFSLLNTQAPKIKKAFIYGQCQQKIFNSLSSDIAREIYNSFEEAVKDACDIAETKDVVLLSPGCASMDMFKNYEERGECFRNLVTKYLELST